MLRTRNGSQIARKMPRVQRNGSVWKVSAPDMSLVLEQLAYVLCVLEMLGTCRDASATNGGVRVTYMHRGFLYYHVELPGS